MAGQAAGPVDPTRVDQPGEPLSPGAGATWAPAHLPDSPGRRRRRTRLIVVGGALAVAVLVAGTAAVVLASDKLIPAADRGKRAGAARPIAALGSAPTPPFPTDTMLIRADTGAGSPAERTSTVETLIPGADGSRAELPGTEPGDGQPAWSHDREQIAVTHRTRNGAGDIYLMSADGSNRRKILEDVTDGRVAWSSGDDRIAYVRQVEGVDQIVIQPLDGSDPTRLTSSPEPKADPAWSADDTSILYGVERDGVEQIYDLPVDNPVEPGRLIGPGSGPALSPDGSRILYARAGNAASTSDIWLVNYDGSDPHPVTRSPARETGPSWSPDGAWFAFERGPDERPTVVVMKPDGAGEAVLTGPGTREGRPSWS